MTDYSIVPALPEHGEFIAKHMRMEDRREVFASHAHSPQQAVMLSLGHSLFARVLLADGVPVCLAGVARTGLFQRRGIVWLLGTAAVEVHFRYFLRHSKAWRDQALAATPGGLENWVDARNPVPLRWLTWLGFTVAPARPFGPFGFDFHHVIYEGS